MEREYCAPYLPSCWLSLVSTQCRVVTNVFCDLTFAEQRETGGDWLARLCDPGTRTVGSCAPLPRSPRRSHGTTFKPEHLKLTGHLASPRHKAAPLQRSFLNPVPQVVISSVVERSPGWRQEVTRTHVTSSVLVLIMRGLLSVRTGLEAREVQQVVSSSCPAQ